MQLLSVFDERGGVQPLSEIGGLYKSIGSLLLITSAVVSNVVSVWLIIFVSGWQKRAKKYNQILILCWNRHSPVTSQSSPVAALI